MMWQAGPGSALFAQTGIERRLQRDGGETGVVQEGGRSDEDSTIWSRMTIGARSMT
jgi:hypothetical protein